MGHLDLRPRRRGRVHVRVDDLDFDGLSGARAGGLAVEGAGACDIDTPALVRLIAIARTVHVHLTLKH